MKEYLKERVLLEARYIFDTHHTIRQTAKKFGYSKSTVHNDVSFRLAKLDPELYSLTRDILKENFEEKHIRGGESTKRKYAQEETMES